MKVSVVILNWNGCDMLRTFLPSVIRYSKSEEVEVCVADNGSTDASVEMLREEFPCVRIIVLDQNHGFADGYNLALQQVEAEYVVLLNSDVEVTEHWLEPMISYLDGHPEVAACQPKIRSQRQKEYFEYAGAAGGFIDKYGYPFCRGRIMGVVEKDEGQYDTILPVFWATGAALFIRHADYREAGGAGGRGRPAEPTNDNSTTAQHAHTAVTVADWTDVSLPTWKRLIYAGDYVPVVGKSFAFLKVRSITSVVQL